MVSGRSLGHTGGTLDKLEAIPGMDVFLDAERFRGVLTATGMVICGQTDNIVPADKKLYALRDATATVSCIPLIASSIMSKKLALGADGIVLDVKTGSGAFMREEADAIRLCRTMAAIGAKTGRPTLGIISSMDQPLGRAVGNALEIAESIEALKGRGPADLMEVSHALGWLMLRAAGQELPYEKALSRFQAAVSPRSRIPEPFRFDRYWGWLRERLARLFEPGFPKRAIGVVEAWLKIHYPGWRIWIWAALALSFCYTAASGLAFAIFVPRGLWGLPLLLHVMAGALFARDEAAVRIVPASSGALAGAVGAARLAMIAV